MLNNKTVAVVVPAYNEETQIRLVIESMPDFVDRIIVVNDCSADKTSLVVRDCISKSAEDTIRLSNVLHEVKPDRYNKASIVVQQLQQEEINKFTPSEVVNTSEETDRVILIEQSENSGVGAAIARGYKWAKDHGIDCYRGSHGTTALSVGGWQSVC